MSRTWCGPRCSNSRPPARWSWNTRTPRGMHERRRRDLGNRSRHRLPRAVHDDHARPRLETRRLDGDFSDGPRSLNAPVPAAA